MNVDINITLLIPFKLPNRVSISPKSNTKKKNYTSLFITSHWSIWVPIPVLVARALPCVIIPFTQITIVKIIYNKLSVTFKFLARKGVFRTELKKK